MRKNILIIEDNDLNQKLFFDLLIAKNYEVHQVRDGKFAIAKIQEIMPDLIVMDMQLPNLSGMDITKWVKATPELSHIPIIAVTAFAMRKDEKLVLESGCDAYLSKPISLVSFLETVENLVK